MSTQHATPAPASFNKVGTLKEIGAIEYRLNDAALPDTLKAAIISRNIENLRDTLPIEQASAIDILDAFCKRHEWGYLAEALQHLRADIPLTWGLITAGTWVEIDGRIGAKRKGGFEVPALGFLPHPAPDTPVKLINH